MLGSALGAESSGDVCPSLRLEWLEHHEPEDDDQGAPS